MPVSATPTPAQVFRAGAPDPGPEVVAVLDVDSDIYRREGRAWRRDGSPHILDWAAVLRYWPLLNCPADYLAALQERIDLDEQRRPRGVGR